MIVGYLLTVLDNISILIHLLGILLGTIIFFTYIVPSPYQDLNDFLIRHKKSIIYIFIGCLLWWIFIPNNITWKWVSREVKENSDLRIEIQQLKQDIHDRDVNHFYGDLKL